ncbi:MAG: hypothetical protein RJA07_1146 [Bacteroidota bacterium]|jgi:hypothetical protein
MKKNILLFLFLVAAYPLYAANNDGSYLIRCNNKLIATVMEDLFVPPVASRVHVYPNIAAYEVLAMGNPQLISLSGQIKHLPKISSPHEKINYSIAAEEAFCVVAKKLVFSEYMIADFEKVEMTNWKLKLKDSTLVSHSIAYGKTAGAEIIGWMMKDNYTTVKTLQRYVIADSLGAWKPTSPDYANALEPNWPLMRPLVMDSASQIKPKPNAAYSEDKNSVYYKLATEVYEQSKKLDSIQKTIAWFWDCNPSISYPKGHVTYYVHKISPGGHWLNITAQACKRLHFDELKTAESYTLVAMGLYEGFLSCWTQKYIANSIRPETYINRLIDAKWSPLIQTPPFPEYTSGHSCISAASANILTALIPQPYSFIDSSEMYIDLPPRSFHSLLDAAAEASVSRFYGGIHFMPALNNGAEQGKAVANYILNHIHTRKK